MAGYPRVAPWLLSLLFLVAMVAGCAQPSTIPAPAQPSTPILTPPPTTPSTPAPPQSPPSTPTAPEPTPTPELVWKTDAIYIDYAKPELYLAPGNQSNLDEQYFNEISQQIKMGGSDLENIGAIFKWKQDYFRTYAAGGEFIGKITVNQIMEEKALSGCHDHGLVLVSVLRKYGFPAIMVDTAGIQWAWDYSQGKRQDFIGHVFVEAYVNGKWILINSTSGEYVEDYDPSNSVLPLTNPAESKGYFALFKGLDPEGYGINSNEQLTEDLRVFAGKAESIEMHFPQYKIKKFPL